MKIAKKITTLKEAQKFDPCYLQSRAFYPHFPIFLVVQLSLLEWCCKSAVCVCRTPRLKLVSVPFSRLVLDMVTLRKDFRRASCIWSAICFKIMTRCTPIRAVFSHVYLQPFLVHDIRAFFCYLYLRSFPLCGVFIPKYMTIFLQTRIYMRTKKFIHMRYKQACVYGVTESCHIRRTELYCQQKTSSCTMELKSNFSLNQAWPQWPR